jgi:ribonucleotide monophosphatase NagD (HAD superfamily)
MVGDRLDNDIQPAQRHGWQVWHLTSGAPDSDQAGGWPQLLTWLGRKE